MCSCYWGHTSASSLTLWPLRGAGVGVTCKRFFTLKQLQFHFYSSQYAGSGQAGHATLLQRCCDCRTPLSSHSQPFSNEKSSSFSRVSTTSSQTLCLWWYIPSFCLTEDLLSGVRGLTAVRINLGTADKTQIVFC